MTKSAVILRRLLCVIIVLSALLTLPNRVSSQTGTRVTLPVSPNVFTCQSSLIEVRVEDVTSLTAYHLEIDFPPGDVQVTAVENGGFIPNGIFEPTNATDNTAGTVVFGMARQNYDTPPANGSGVLIYLSVQGVNPGAAVNFTIRPYVAGTEPTNGSGSMLVGWPDLTPIPFTITNGTVYTQSCISTDILLSNNQINENLPLGSAIGTFTTIDPDGSAGFSYALWDTATYPDNVYFTISGNELRTNAVFNYEADSSYTIRVRSWSDVDPYFYKTFTITITDANDPPAANGQAKSVAEDTPLSITLTGSDVEGSPLTYSIVTQPSHGTLSGSGAARTYTPAANYNGADSFTFRVYDGAAYSSPATVSITVTPVNDAPVGVADFYYLNSTMYYDTNGDDIKDTYQLIANVDPPGVLQNDSDVDLDALSVTLKTNVAKGTLVLNPNGSFTYTPNQSLLQDTDSFVYTLSDGHGGSKDVTVSITIDRVGPAEVAQWLTPINAPAGSSNYYGMTYDASTTTVPLKVFVNNTSDVAKVEFRWYDHTQTPGVWQIISEDETPTLESGKYVYTATLNMDLLPFTDQIQVWAYTYDAAGSFTRIVKVNNYDYWARILVNHNPSGYNVFLPFIRR